MSRTVSVKRKGNGLAYDVLIDDKPVDHVVSVSYSVNPNEMAIARMEVLSIDGFDADVDRVMVKFTPKTVYDAAKVLRMAFKDDVVLRDSLIASIDSVLNGRFVKDEKKLAEKIANRIIGIE